MHYTLYLSSICFILFLALLYLAFLINQYKHKYDQQSLKLIQTHLNKEFVNRVLDIILNNDISNEDKMLILTSKIKEYFDLDEIIFYHQDNLMNEGDNSTFYGSIIRSYVDDNVNLISNALKTKLLDVRTMEHDNIYFILYIIPIEDNVKVKFIIFAQRNRDQLLNSRDREVLSNPIKNILSAIFRKNV